ncbi:M16 family metallopeptidase [Phenylobacterium soli]|uniref:Insulinase family protein n=1 Tax=Phenylobacterium soli TaxID=2170551 RepID=A0A328ANC2_9CAUL|nr:insulinase family protein [Phenylobacterium soli]RAK55871.1 insulinase family protein [Phenylobacterium soli]
MTRPLRASLALAATLSLLAVSGAFALSLPHLPHIPRVGPHASETAPRAARLKPGEWPQARSDVQVDPDIRFGALPNGMRYAIRKQSIPAGQAAVRFYIDAGSLEETDAQQGLAHFLEHMAFKGSKAVPENDMIKILQRHGLAFGADTNASTGFSQTIYKLDLPHTDDETVDTSLMLMREIASNLTLSQEAMDHERGVVLSEERTRDTPSYRILKSRFSFLFPGQRLPTRYPIGQVDVLKTAPVSQIADFYHRYYRPDRAVLVVVGDFDPAAMEAKIKARFGDWTPVGPAGTDPDLGKVKPRETEARLIVEPGAPLGLQMTWVRTPDLSADTLAKRRREIVRLLGFQVLNRRFQALARSPQPPFLAAGAFKADQEHSAEVTMVVANAAPDRWQPALDAMEQETRRAALYGVRQDELDREIVELRASLKAAAAGAATRRQAELADEIVGSLDDQEVVTNPAQDLAFFDSAVKDLKAKDVSEALKSLFNGAGPLLFVSTPKPVEGGDQALLTALKAFQKTEVSAPAAQAQVTWPYESFGPPGKVAESKDITDLETTFVRFENGVRLTVKPTKFRDDEVLVRVNIGRGMLDLPRDRQSLKWASGAVIEGGLKKISNEDMERVLASKVFGATFGVGEDAFVLSGTTRREDLDTELQVLTAYASEPGWRPQGFERIKAASKTLQDQYEATDSGVLGRDLSGLLHGGDRRFTFPSRSEMASASLADLQAQVAGHLAQDPIELVVVGDVSVEAATDAVARTFGALPPRKPLPPLDPAQEKVAFPAPTAQPLVLTHKGRADQAIAYMAWPTADFWSNPQRAREDAVMGEVMGLRLIEQIRQVQGATYSPSVSYSHSLVWTGWGYVSAAVEVPPQKLDGFFADVAKIAADLAAKGPTADELERAKKPRIDAIRKSQVTNQYWLSELSGAQEDPRHLDFIRQLVPGTERVSAVDVQRAAATFLQDAKAWKLEVRAQSAK